MPNKNKNRHTPIVLKRSFKPGTIINRLGNVMYTIQGKKFTHRRHIDQIQKRGVEEPSSSPTENDDSMDAIFEAFEIQRPQEDTEIRRSNIKRKFTEPLIIDHKRKKH